MDRELGDVGFNGLLERIIEYFVRVVKVGDHEQVGRNGQLGHHQPHLLYMQREGTAETGIFRVDGQGKKRFCCGAAKRLKDKCLRFHQSQDMCVEFIKGHQECVAVKRKFESSQLPVEAQL